MNKRIAVLSIISVLSIIGVGSILNGLGSPKSLKIDRNIIKFPDKMHLREISLDNKRLNAFDLFFANEPFEIKFPKEDIVSISISNKESNALLLLLPNLTNKTFNLYAGKGEKEGGCQISTADQKIYLLNLTNGRGYSVFSENKDIENKLKKLLCRDNN